MANYRKKGSVTGAIGTLVALVVGVAVTTLILIFTGSLGGQTYSLTEAQINEIGIASPVTGNTFTALNSTAVSLAHPNINPTSLVITNATNTLTNGTDYLADYAAGTVTLTNSLHNNTILTASYTYDNATVRTFVKNSIINGFDTMETTSEYLPIVVLAVIISIVLVLVLSFTDLSSGKGGKGTAL